MLYPPKKNIFDIPYSTIWRFFQIFLVIFHYFTSAFGVYLSDLSGISPHFHCHPPFVARVAGSWQIASAEKNAEHLRAGRDPCPLSLDMMSTSKRHHFWEKT
jgi:hypothetical protein